MDGPDVFVSDARLGEGVAALPEAIGRCAALEKLYLSWCSKLTALPEGDAAPSDAALAGGALAVASELLMWFVLDGLPKYK